MALGDLIHEQLSTIIEIITLSLIVLGFFRWYDAKYTRTVKEVNTAFDIRIQEIHVFLNRLDDRLHDYIIQHRSRNSTRDSNSNNEED